MNLVDKLQAPDKLPTNFLFDIVTVSGFFLSFFPDASFDFWRHAFFTTWPEQW